MLIRVRYVDNRFDMVRPEILDRLIETGKVREFERRDGWVMPGIANLRRKNRNRFSGTDRRSGHPEERRAS